MKEVKLKIKGFTCLWTEYPELNKEIQRLLTIPQKTYTNVYIRQHYTKKGFKLGLVDFLNQNLQNFTLEGEPCHLYYDLPNEVKDLSDDIIQEMSLRDYQIDAVREVYKHKGLCIVQSPTGSGKTHIAVALAKICPLPLLFLVPNKTLLIQSYNYFKKYGFRVTMYFGEAKDLSGEIVIMTSQSLVRPSKVLEDNKGRWQTIIADECHHFTKKGYTTLIRYPTKIRIGLSATPISTEWQLYDKVRLYSIFGPIAWEGKSNKEVLQNIIKPEVFVIDTNYDNAKIYDVLKALDQKDFIELKRHALVRNNKRNLKILAYAEMARVKKLKVFIMVSWTQHLDQLKEINAKYNIIDDDKIVYLTGDTDIYTRNKTFKGLETEEDPFVICGTIGNEGVDIKSLDLVILADVGKSYIKIIQSIGRATRTALNKAKAYVIDFRDSMFIRHFNKRKKIYKDEGFTVLSEKDFVKKIFEI